MDQLIALIAARQQHLPCGEIGYLQLSTWAALDLGLTFEQWVEALTKVENATRAPATLRKQWRLSEVDRNACLIDDEQPRSVTTWGRKAP